MISNETKQIIYRMLETEGRLREKKRIFSDLSQIYHMSAVARQEMKETIDGGLHESRLKDDPALKHQFICELIEEARQE